MRAADFLQAQILALLQFCRAPGSRHVAGGLAREKRGSQRLQPLLLSVRASYRPPRGPPLLGRPLPIMSIWALALLFVCLVVIPDLNQKLMSLPIPSAKGLLTLEAPVALPSLPEEDVAVAVPAQAGKTARALMEDTGSPEQESPPAKAPEGVQREGAGESMHGRDERQEKGKEKREEREKAKDSEKERVKQEAEMPKETSKKEQVKHEAEVPKAKESGKDAPRERERGKERQASKGKEKEEAKSKPEGGAVPAKKASQHEKSDKETQKPSEETSKKAKDAPKVEVLATEEEAFWLDPASDGAEADQKGKGAGKDKAPAGKSSLRSAGSFDVSPSARRSKDGSASGPQSSDVAAWPNKLILALAVGYRAENVSAIVRTFQRNVAGARLVLFVDKPIRGWKPKKGVVIQPFHKPQTGLWSRLPVWLVRFQLYKLFLETIRAQRDDRRHSTVIVCDARDVAFLGDPFPFFRNSTSVYLFQESSSFPDKDAKKLSNNHKWVSACFGSKTAFSFAGKRVVNAGFMAGTFQAMEKLTAAIAREAERLPEDTCTATWGSDQAILNYLVRSGSLRATVPFILEDNDHGAVMQRFTKKAVVQVMSQEDGDYSEPLLKNKDGRPILAIHGYDRFSDTHDVIKQLV